MKKNLDFAFPAVVVIATIVLSFFALPYHVDSMYDEGYLWLCVQNAMNGKVRGSSLWANMLVALLGDKICSSILALRIVNAVLSILSAFAFWLLTHSLVTKDRVSSIAYLILVFFLLNPICTIIICYNGISRFLLLLACAASLRLFYENKSRKEWIWAVLIGFTIMLSFFSILPSAVMVGGSVILLSIIYYWKKWNKMMKVFGMMALGAIAALLITHWFFADMRDVLASMKDTAQTITKVNRGYDPLSFVISVLFFVRDISFYILTSVGIIMISLFIKKNGFSWVASLFYVISFFVYWHYQEKPSMTLGMQLSLIWLQPLVTKWKDKQIHSIKELFTFDSIFNLFLIIFPVLAVLGTNLPLGLKIGWFIVPWALVSWRLGFGEANKQFRGEVLLLLSLVMVLGLVSGNKGIDKSQTVVDHGALKGMHLTKQQECHFHEVQTIMDEYQFRKGESVVYATYSSYMTVCYLDAVPCGLFFQPPDFVAHASEDLPTPDFIFMDIADDWVATETMKKMPWGWPDEFDKYFVGTPEHIVVDWSTDRHLYCRKCLKK